MAHGRQRLLDSLGLAEDIRARLLANGSWRLMMIVGAAPALLCFFFRLFVPESQRWEEERQRGSTSHWATRDLLGVLIGLGRGVRYHLSLES